MLDRSETLQTPNGPPMDLEAERAVIAHGLAVPGSLDDVRMTLTEEDFYAPTHRHVWRAMLALSDAEMNVELVAVAGWLKDRDKLEQVGGTESLAELLDTPPILDPGQYATTVVAKSKLRKLIKIVERVAVEARSDCGDANDFVGRVEHSIFELNQETMANEFPMLGELVSNRMEVINERSRGIVPTDVIPSSLSDLNRRIYGYQRQHMQVIAGRPGTGKTSLMLQELYRGAAMKDDQGRHKFLCVFFSLEQPRSQCAERLICQRSGVANTVLRRGKLEDGDWTAVAGAAKELADIPLWIVDKANISVAEMRAQLRRGLAKYRKRFGDQLQFGLVGIDYIQLMRAVGKHNNRTEAVGELSRDVLAATKSMGLTTIVASQLSRANVKDKRPPSMEDLRESGQIEQDAQLIMFVHDSDMPKPPKQTCTDQIIIGKMREGGAGGYVSVNYDGPTLTFSDPQPDVEGGYDMGFDSMETEESWYGD